MNVPGAWVSITNDIKILVENGVEVWVHCVPMVPNITHVSALRDLCVKMGVKKLNLLRFVPQTRGYIHREQLLPSPRAFADLQKVLDYEFNDKDRKDLSTILRAGCPVDFRHMLGLLDEKAKLCHAGIDLILVRPDGTVHPCAAWKSLPGDSNVRDKSLHEIWHGDKTFQIIRNFTYNGYKALLGKCRSCQYVDSCRGGCPAQRLHAYGKEYKALYANRPDPLCTAPQN
jgi:radical SAM protein with 4Fe4S-binding SPASM domain